ncbi:MAG TPA: tRNA preQ1(34) S-adenosylmethionine ribosyltransferase-isomerase QueA [Gemmatimonadota bacterium]|nr:tRNA preQ1(34) S-adenosylmethionine ribosyltransferase-isomerase QueA [Gemmatimonadota bacterium]
MRMDRFDYALPPERIAQRPLDRRDASRLLIVDRSAGAWRDARFPDLAGELESGDLLVVNDTSVFPARLFARRSTGGRIEILLARAFDAEEPDRAQGREWEALVRPARRVRPGEALELLARDGTPAPKAVATVLKPVATTGTRRIRLDVPGDAWAWIAENGHVPLPPYIARADAPSDRERYQTVYARHRGAVAAPTAGLHFTEALLERLEARGVSRAALTLHVGPGTFRPVTAERAEDHVMEPEWYRISPETGEALARARTAGGRVVAVGTTTVRALESAARDDADRKPTGAPAGASGWTDLTICPGHRFRSVDALVTNFHLPRSSLLLLVAAFAGVDLTLAAYRHAVDAGYRFYSYGDAMLIV